MSMATGEAVSQKVENVKAPINIDQYIGYHRIEK